MKTSWNDTNTIDHFIFGELKPKDEAQFIKRMLVDPILKINFILQRKLHFLVRQYGRKKLKAELETIHHELFNDPVNDSFRKKIMQQFKT